MVHVCNKQEFSSKKVSIRQFSGISVTRDSPDNNQTQENRC